jgi:hypothetical protein
MIGESNGSLLLIVTEPPDPKEMNMLEYLAALSTYG